MVDHFAMKPLSRVSPQDELIDLLALAVARHIQRSSEKTGDIRQDWTFGAVRACMSSPKTTQEEDANDST